MTSRADSFLLHALDDGEADAYELSAREARGYAPGQALSADPEPTHAGTESTVAAAGRSAGNRGGWRPLGLFWGILLAATGLAAVGLQLAGPPVAQPSPPPAAPTPATPPPPMFPPLANTAAPTPREPAAQALPPAPPALPKRSSAPDMFTAPAVRPTDAASSSRQPAAPDLPKRPPASDPSAPQTARPPDATTAFRQPPAASDLSPEPPRPARKPAPPAAAPPDQSASPAAVSSGSASSSLLIHYPSGSYATLTDAQRLAAQADLGSDPTVVADAGSMPATATIKYSDTKDHAAAQALGKALAKLGYKWRIERATGQPAAALEVFMPVK